MNDLDSLCINTIRVLSADMVQNAKSGHPGAPMGCAPLAHVLFTKFMRFSPKNTRWMGRDRFVLSNGHACALQYSMLHLLGYDLSMEELKRFRQVDSLTPGHPEANHTPGIEVTTGPLGQGFANAVGMAMAGAHLAATFNRPGVTLLDNYIYALCGDGCLMEGVTSEAASLAGHLGLGNLIVFYDQNHISIDGGVDLAFTEDVKKRFEAYHWNVEYVQDGDHDLEGIATAIRSAHLIKDKPSIIIVRTTIGYGSANQGSEKVHGSPLGDEDLAKVKQTFGFNPKQFFFIPEDVKNYYSSVTERGAQLEKEYNILFDLYERKYPELAKEFRRRVEGALPVDWKKNLPKYTPNDAAKATRQSSNEVLNKLAEVLPELVGGSADLTHSNLTNIKNAHDFQKNHYDGRYFRFGVREHAMFAAANGMAAFNAVIPFVATFLNFITYGWGAARLSALSKFRVIYIMTHDSIGLGEDGPTHQPIEVPALCRSTPNMLFIRPADGNEVVGSYILAIEKNQTPTVISLTRQALPQLQGSSSDKVALGGYILQEVLHPKIILAATGSEVSICVETAELLNKEGFPTRVVSMPCWLLFDQQPGSYRESVFPDGIPVLSVEAYSTVGWARYAHASVGIDTFGNSGPYKDVYKKFNLFASSIAEKAKQTIQFFAQRPPQSLVRRPFMN